MEKIECNPEQDYSPSSLLQDLPLNSISPFVINNIGDSLPLFHNSFNCGLKTRYEDLLYSKTCENHLKGQRRWRILDFCTGSVIDTTQILEIVDTTPPQFNVVMIDSALNRSDLPFGIDLSLTVDSEELIHQVFIRNETECTVDFGIPEFDGLWDNCTTRNDISVSYSLNGEPDAEGDTVKNLAPGIHSLKVYARDKCGNTAYQPITVIVLDKSPPIAGCLKFFHIPTLSSQTGGITRIDNRFFDNSSDACSEIVLRLARRLDNKFFCSGQRIQFIGTEYIEFCCEDIGKRIPVRMKFFDEFGNSSECDLVIDVGNALSSAQVPCETIEISCQESLHPNDVGYPQVMSNPCSKSELQYMDSVLSVPCQGQTIYRHWDNLFDGQTCIQRIRVKPSGRIDWTKIKWPLHRDGRSYAPKILERDLTVSADFYSSIVVRSVLDNGRSAIRHYGDSQDHASLNVPLVMPPGVECIDEYSDSISIEDSSCSMLSVSIEEIIANNATGCTGKVRQWTLVDWCRYQPNSKVYPDYFQLMIDQIDSSIYFVLDTGNTVLDGIYEFEQRVAFQNIQDIDTLQLEDLHLGLDKACNLPLGTTWSLAEYDYCNEHTTEYAIRIIHVDSGYETIYEERAPADNGSFDLSSLGTGKYIIEGSIKNGCSGQLTITQNLSIEDRIKPEALCKEYFVVFPENEDD